MKQRRDRATREFSVSRRVAGGLGWASVILIVWLVAGFVREFELLGLPVRDNTHGWLGPTPRSRVCVEDIGKVNCWTCNDIAVFTRHRLGCWVWLKLNALDAGK